MSYWIIHIVLLGVLSYFGFRFLKSDVPNYIYWLALALKLTAGIALGYIFYNYYGTGDSISFFEAAKDSLASRSNEPRTQFFIYILSPLVKSTGGSYWITSLWLSFVSFMACWYATLTLTQLYKNLQKIIVICFLFIPSIVFWSSGIMKDTLAFASMITIVTLMVKFYKQSRLSILDLLLLLLSAFLLLKIKHYLLISCLIFSGILAASILLKKMNGKWKWALAAAVLISALVSTQFIHPYLKIDRVAWTLYENNQAIVQKTDADDQLDIVIEDESWFSVIKQAPKALHAGLFRPSILDHTPIWGWIHRIENLVLTTLLCLSLLLSFKLKPKIDWPILIAATICILMLAIMLPLSTPNFGTLVRYKNAYMPYLFLISSLLPYRFLTSQTEE